MIIRNQSLVEMTIPDKRYGMTSPGWSRLRRISHGSCDPHWEQPMSWPNRHKIMTDNGSIITGTLIALLQRLSSPTSRAEARRLHRPLTTLSSPPAQTSSSDYIAKFSRWLSVISPAVKWARTTVWYGTAWSPINVIEPRQYGKIHKHK